MKRISDIALIRSVISLYNIIGTFPPILKKPAILTSIFTVVLLVLSLVVTKVFISDIFMVFTFTPTAITLYIGATLTVIAFNFLCLKNLWFYPVAWSDLFELIEEFDINMEKYKVHLKENALLYYIKIITCNIGNLLLYMLLTFSVKLDFDYKIMIYYGYSLFANMQIFSSILILWDLLRIICKRYKIIEKLITNTYQTPTVSNISWNRYQFKVLVSLLNDMVTTIDQFFGPRILLMLMLTIFNVLNVFQYLFLDFPLKEQQSIFHRITVCIETCWLLVSIT